MEQKLGKINLSLFSLCLRILMWNIRIRGFLSFLLFCFKFVHSYVSLKWKAWTKTRNNSNCEQVKQGLDYIKSGARVCKEDIVLVMEKLGMKVQRDIVDGIEEFGEQEIEQLFEKGITWSEVKEAFDVFDQNKDGFIEARELQRVLSCLGLRKNLMECQKMINAVDQNGDELIDHKEFVRIMQESFG
ncbi:hypothetical protein RJT34_06834 [Clitoria ternatea]|uniref:EF-hand domain-containing protein n=1 Tax=Clitoria ternatea TaxID=43366 RepID=A0AAN9K3T5_CLITE